MAAGSVSIEHVSHPLWRSANVDTPLPFYLPRQSRRHGRIPESAKFQGSSQQPFRGSLRKSDARHGTVRSFPDGGTARTADDPELLRREVAERVEGERITLPLAAVEADPADPGTGPDDGEVADRLDPAEPAVEAVGL